MKKYGEFQCPICGKYPPEDEYKKKVNGKFKTFPIIINMRYSYSGENSGHYWDEIHYCCKNEFTIHTSDR